MTEFGGQDKSIGELQRIYYDEIASIADEMVEEHNLEERTYQDSEDARDWLHETIDGHQYVIYTWKARLVGLVSDKDEAWENALDSSEGISYEQKAYFAMMADVFERLGNPWFWKDRITDKEKHEKEML